MMLRFKATNYIQAELFKECAFETATGIYDHIGTAINGQSVDWAGLVMHNPNKEIWKVGPLAVILKQWWNDFSGKMTLEEYLKCPPIVIEVLSSINDNNKAIELTDITAMKKKLEEMERALGKPKK